ncbi:MULTISPECIES: sulfur carrier protein ThiS [Pseudoalteromonas]|uniref:Sulfur carrier protein ThiS n=1 Tax=Pseudoalteromonas haloplanktis TaxID=228 RepID=A0ABU1BBG2_PSEHA|nr:MULTISPECIES: sulfur carrier protein ThiS [Pseudoalteromonas]MDQ9091836.1 sulfur carrier protein ThiS [Pseudoalteromonas haloplanktis]TMN69892.1 thiamine biosynthesis protein ThiS [Pseudoalteromonas sp. S1727]
MKITINGESFELVNTANLTQALQQFAAKEPFAVAINGQFIPRSQCDTHLLNEGDSIELLSPIQGG